MLFFLKKPVILFAINNFEDVMIREIKNTMSCIANNPELLLNTVLILSATGGALSQKALHTSLKTTGIAGFLFGFVLVFAATWPSARKTCQAGLSPTLAIICGGATGLSSVVGASITRALLHPR
jgi:uncharacterized membrane protein YhhN